MANMITRCMSVDRWRFVTGTLLLGWLLLPLLAAMPWPFLAMIEPGCDCCTLIVGSEQFGRLRYLLT